MNQIICADPGCRTSLTLWQRYIYERTILPLDIAKVINSYLLFFCAGFCDWYKTDTRFYCSQDCFELDNQIHRFVCRQMSPRHRELVSYLENDMRKHTRDIDSRKLLILFTSFKFERSLSSRNIEYWNVSYSRFKNSFSTSKFVNAGDLYKGIDIPLTWWKFEDFMGSDPYEGILKINLDTEESDDEGCFRQQ